MKPHLASTILPLTALLLTLCACQAVPSMTWNETHGGIKYSIDRDLRFNRIEKGKDGSLLYDSPELTVVCQQGHLTINGVDSGSVQKGDTVQITEFGTVNVNGQRRGDQMTGAWENQKRVKQTKHEWVVK